MTGLAAGIPVNAAADGSSSASFQGSSQGVSQGVKNYVRLGRTELKVSDISFGSFPLRHGEEHVVHHAMDQGITISIRRKATVAALQRRSWGVL